MAKNPIYKGKSTDTQDTCVGRLCLENRGEYFIINDDVGIKKQIILKSLSTATKKEYDTFVRKMKDI